MARRPSRRDWPRIRYRHHRDFSYRPQFGHLHLHRAQSRRILLHRRYGHKSARRFGAPFPGDHFRSWSGWWRTAYGYVKCKDALDWRGVRQCECCGRLLRLRLDLQARYRAHQRARDALAASRTNGRHRGLGDSVLVYREWQQRNGYRCPHSNRNARPYGTLRQGRCEGRLCSWA